MVLPLYIPDSATTSTNPTSSPSTFFDSSYSSPHIQTRSSSVVNKPTYLQDYHCSLVSHPQQQHIDAHSTSVPYPISQVISYHHLSPKFKAVVLSISSQIEPQFYSQAAGKLEWDKQWPMNFLP